MRRAAKVDTGQQEMVNILRKIPGMSVEVGHDDILVGMKGKTYWFELKSPDAISKRTGRVKDSEITRSERDRLDNWKGHYSMVWDIMHIIEEVGV